MYVDSIMYVLTLKELSPVRMRSADRAADGRVEHWVDWGCVGWRALGGGEGGR